MRKMYIVFAWSILVVSATLRAMQDVPFEKKVTSPRCTRIYHYDATCNRWKLKKEICIKSHAGHHQYITKKYVEKPHLVEVDESIFEWLDCRREEHWNPGKPKPIAQEDYEALDYKEHKT